MGEKKLMPEEVSYQDQSLWPLKIHKFLRVIFCETQMNLGYLWNFFSVNNQFFCDSTVSQKCRNFMLQIKINIPHNKKGEIHFEIVAT